MQSSLQLNQNTQTIQREDNKNSVNYNYTTLETKLGSMIGIEENGYRLFRGIPYASPPIGEKRWTSPSPVSGFLNKKIISS